MTEATTAKAEVHVATIFAATLGHDLMAAILAELRTMPDHWLRMNEENQQKAIARLRDKVKTMVHETTQILMRGEFPAVPCEIDGIKITKDVQISLTMQPGAAMRHSLYDAKGTHVLLVLSDTSRWLERMDEIKAKADQLQLFEDDYDPAVDQPGYRRDQDRTAPAGSSWADLKKTLGATNAPDGETNAPKSETTATPEGESKGDLVFGSANDKVDAAAQLALLLERLYAIGMTISLGTLQTFTPEQIKVTEDWLAAYIATPEGEQCPVARPFFLPIPDPNGDDKTEG